VARGNVPQTPAHRKIAGKGAPSRAAHPPGPPRRRDPPRPIVAHHGQGQFQGPPPATSPAQQHPAPVRGGRPARPFRHARTPVTQPAAGPWRGPAAGVRTGFVPDAGHNGRR